MVLHTHALSGSGWKTGHARTLIAGWLPLKDGRFTTPGPAHLHKHALAASADRAEIFFQSSKRCGVGCTVGRSRSVPRPGAMAASHAGLLVLGQLLVAHVPQHGDCVGVNSAQR